MKLTSLKASWIGLIALVFGSLFATGKNCLFFLTYTATQRPSEKSWNRQSKNDRDCTNSL